MGQNRKKHRQNSHLINHFPTSEGVSEVSGASERANGRVSGPVLQSVFLAALAYSGMGAKIRVAQAYIRDNMVALRGI